MLSSYHSEDHVGSQHHMISDKRSHRMVWIQFQHMEVFFHLCNGHILEFYKDCIPAVTKMNTSKVVSFQATYNSIFLKRKNSCQIQILNLVLHSCANYYIAHMNLLSQVRTYILCMNKSPVSVWWTWGMAEGRISCLIQLICLSNPVANTSVHKAGILCLILEKNYSRHFHSMYSS